VDVEVFRVIDVLVWTGLDCVEDSRFQIQENGARNITSIVRLVEEDILSVSTLCRKVFKVAILIDTMLLTKLLPELRSNCIVSASVIMFCAQAIWAIARGRLQ
jgi:hypothetical protein